MSLKTGTLKSCITKNIRLTVTKLIKGKKGIYMNTEQWRATSIWWGWFVSVSWKRLRSYVKYK